MNLLQKLLLPAACLIMSATHSQVEIDITVCAGETIDLDDVIPGCSTAATYTVNNSECGIICSNCNGNNLTPCTSEDWTITINDPAPTCPDEVLLNINYISAEFDATSAGACHLVDLAANDPQAGCIYTYTIEGEDIIAVNGVLDDYQFQNGGDQAVTLTVSCGGCEASETVIVDAPGVDAQLSYLSEDDALFVFFNPTFNSYALCSGDGCEGLVINDETVIVGPGGVSYDLSITQPVDPAISSPAEPTDFVLDVCDFGYYIVDYTVTVGVCEGTITDSIYFGNANPPELGLAFDLAASYCQGQVVEIEICLDGCETNPPGTIYGATIECMDIHQVFNSIPVDPIEIQMTAPTCAMDGYCPDACSCALIIFAENACQATTSENCPLRVRPQPNAEFDIIPYQEDNVYCISEDVDCDPVFQETLCGGAAGTLCMIINPEWTISPATGWVLLDGTALDEDFISIDFTVPGNYEICFSWGLPVANGGCGIDEVCKNICVVDDSTPEILWGTASCEGDVASLNIEGTVIGCGESDLQWNINPQTGATLSATGIPDPTITFNEPGNYFVTIEGTLGCAVIDESFNYSICAPPDIDVPDVQTCAGQTVDLTALLEIDDQGCDIVAGGIEWDLVGAEDPELTGLNPGDAAATSWLVEDTYISSVFVENECGPATAEFTVVVSDAPACVITASGPFCPGEIINLDIPGAACTSWELSFDNGNTWIPTPMPVAATISALFRAAGCTSGGCPCTPEPLQVVVFEVPGFEIVADNADPCYNELVTFTIDPVQPLYTWFTNDINTGISGEPLELNIDELTNVQVEVTYGDACIAQDALSIDVPSNPIELECVFPDPFCLQLACEALPALDYPPGGTWHIEDASGITVISNPAEICPDDLGIGNFFLYYTLTDYGPESCDYYDSCNVVITGLNIPELNTGNFVLCYNETFTLEDASALNGTWSAIPCPGIITGNIVDPASAVCEETSVVITYSGDCIDTTEINLTIIPVPVVTVVEDVSICANSSTSLEGNITGIYTSAEWQLTWPGGQAVLPLGSDFVPGDYLGIDGGDVVTAVLMATTDTDPVCQASASYDITIIGVALPELMVENPQCLADAVTLPACSECSSYAIDFFLNDVFVASCNIPGAPCNLPSTGNYDYTIVATLAGDCTQSITGNVLILDVPTTSFIEATPGDPCAPISDYIVQITGEAINIEWNTEGTIVVADMSGDNYHYTIDHSAPVVTDQLYLDEIVVTNACGSASDSFEVLHIAPLDGVATFTDQVLCSPAQFELLIDFPGQNVDSIVFISDNIIISDTIIYGEPSGLILLTGESALIDEEINIQLIAYNECSTQDFGTYQLTILEPDVVSGFTLVYDVPLCEGDEVEINTNAAGNIEDIYYTSAYPGLQSQEIFGQDVIIMPDGLPDSVYVITENVIGSCGSAQSTQPLETGPTAQALFYYSETCLGEETFFYNVSPDSGIFVWDLGDGTPVDVFIPDPYTYPVPGFYEVELVVMNDTLCTGTYSNIIEVTEPDIPIIEVYADGTTPIAENQELDISTFLFVKGVLDDYESYDDFRWFINGEFIGNAFVASAYDYFSYSNEMCLEATDENGCPVRVCRHFFISGSELFVPNAFTPDYDGFNDQFIPLSFGVDPHSYEFYVINRWGDTIFYTKDINEPWTGNCYGGEFFAEDGVYTYVVKWNSLDGNRLNQEDKGHVVIIR